MLASEYGWAKDAILDQVYFDELFYLSREINRRHNTEYKMQLAITQNPHVKEPQQLWKMLEAQEDKPRPVEFDAAGFDRLKNTIGGMPGSKMIIKNG